MKDRITLEDIKNKFIKIEKKYDVFNLNYNGVFFWKLIRFDLFSLILKSNGIYEDAHPFTFKQKLIRLAKLLKYSTLNLIKKRKIKKSKYLLLTHGRKTLYNNMYEDIYLMDYIEEIIKRGEEFLIVDRPDHSGNHIDMKQTNLIYFERFGHCVREFFYPFFSWKYNLKTIQSELKSIEEDLIIYFGLKISLMQIIKKRIFRFIFEKKYFDKLLDNVNPEEIILVVSYGKEELIASANERAIKVTEVQHGIINEYHMGYYFPYNTNIPYFPDEMKLFGEYWKSSGRYPNNCILGIGSFSFFSNIGKNSPEIKEDRVVFISQGTIGKVMSDIAVNFAESNNMECFYKLHPSEYNVWKTNYQRLNESAQSGRIKVITNEISIDELFRINKYIIGHNSTAIFEALKFNCYVYVLKLEGYQYMDYLIRNDYVKLISANFNVNDLLNNKIIKIDPNMLFQA